MRWLMDMKMMSNIRTPSSCSPKNHGSNERDTDFRSPMEYQGLGLDQDVGLLDTICELPEHCENTESISDKKTAVEESTSESDILKTKSDVSSKSCYEMPTAECEDESNSKPNPTSCLPSISSPTSSSPTSPPPSHHSKADQEDALSADEGIQTSPPFERDDPWDHDDLEGETPRPRRYSMSAVMVQRPRRLNDDDGIESVTLRSPIKSWLAEELKARRSRYRPKSCSSPHVDWLKQRTETALDRSAEMQRRTAELLQAAKAIRDQEV